MTQTTINENMLSRDEMMLSSLKDAAKELESEINIIRQFAAKSRDELRDLRGVMMDARDQHAILVDLKDKVEEIHNKICLVTEETVTGRDDALKRLL